MRKRNILYVLYTWSVIIAAVYVLYKLFPTLDIDAGRELLVMAALIIVAEWFAVTFPQGAVSAGFAALLATFIIYGGAEAVYVAGLSTLVGQGIVNRGNPLRTILFNAAQYLLATYAAFFVFNFVGGAEAAGLTGNFIPLMMFIISYYITNHLLVYLYQLPRKNIYPTANWLDALRWDALSYLITVPVGMLMVLLHGSTNILGPVLLFLPIIAVQHILKMYINLDLANRELTALYHISVRLAITDLDKLLDLILKEYKRIAGYHSAVIYVWREDKGCFVPMAVNSPFAHQLKKLAVYKGEGMVGSAAENQEDLLVQDVRQRPELRAEPGLPRIMRSLMVVPLVSDSGVVGIIVVGSRQANGFDRHHLHVLKVMAGQAAVAVSNAMLSNRLRLYF